MDAIALQCRPRWAAGCLGIYLAHARIVPELLTCCQLTFFCTFDSFRLLLTCFVYGFVLSQVGLYLATGFSQRVTGLLHCWHEACNVYGMTNIHRCGHVGFDPRNMGRGAARQRRLTEHYARLCESCALIAEAAHVDSLTNLDPIQRAARHEVGIQRVLRNYR